MATWFLVASFTYPSRISATKMSDWIASGGLRTIINTGVWLEIFKNIPALYRLIKAMFLKKRRIVSSKRYRTHIASLTISCLTSSKQPQTIVTEVNEKTTPTLKNFTRYRIRRIVRCGDAAIYSRPAIRHCLEQA